MFMGCYEIGSWRVTSFSEGLARVIETDSPRSRTLVVSTFPTPLSRTGQAGFLASGSPGLFPFVMAGIRMSFGLRASRTPPSSLPQALPGFTVYMAFPCSDYYPGSVTIPLSW